jgi:tetratricopeptide (TPR) repeat protein
VERFEAFRRAVSLNPVNALAQAELAGALAEMGRFEEARANAQRAVALAPAQPSFLELRARVTARLGMCDESASLSRRAAELQGLAELRAGTACRPAEAPGPN